MENFRLRVHKVIEKIKENNLNENDLKSLNSICDRKLQITDLKLPKKIKLALFLFIAALLWHHFADYFNDDKCYVALPDTIARAFRPMQSCNFCKDVVTVDSVYNLSPDEFEQKYAYNGRPVVVKDATINWTAPQVFDFKYFKQLYLNSNGTKSNCQFFRYKTEFKSLREALSMDDDRAEYRSGKPWYFGWSNCDHEIGEKLRRHYTRPYFLPRNSENNAVDWIFMGGTGFGAHMHVDNVRLPSWQAQIRGSKVWTLAPPPECYYQCRWFTVKMNKGDTSKD